MNFELVIPYYKRPKIVLNALDSIKNSNNKNYKLTLIDDSGTDEFGWFFLNYGFDSSKIQYVPILMSDEEKIKIGGSLFGKYVNDVIKTSDADVLILICDDDAILPTYLDDLTTFFMNNPSEVWGYSHVKFYNPNHESYLCARESLPEELLIGHTNLNLHTDRINPHWTVDSSQVVFKIEALREKNVLYPYPKTIALDADIFMSTYNVYGSCSFTGVFGQCKGWFDEQLGRRCQNGNIYI
jgi:glycosyltransferase involved in cell wall biosynthesis